MMLLENNLLWGGNINLDLNWALLLYLIPNTFPLLLTAQPV